VGLMERIGMVVMMARMRVSVIISDFFIFSPLLFIMNVYSK
jgi:hypothetical protein